MEKIKVKTYSPTTSSVKITLSAPCGKVLIKNFGDESIYIGTTAGSTKTDGMIRIPPMTAQYFAPDAFEGGSIPAIEELYLVGDKAQSNTVEIMEMR